VRRIGGLVVATLGVCLLVGCGVRAQAEPEPLGPSTAGAAPTPTVSVQPDVPDDAGCAPGRRSPTPSVPAPSTAPTATPAPSVDCPDGS
jgi:hypothetical protein